MHEQVQTRVRADLANRGRHGLWAHFLGVFITAALHWDQVEGWNRRWWYLAALILMTTLRTFLSVFGSRLPMTGRDWFRVYGILLAATAAAWGSLLADALIHAPWTPETTMVLCMMLAIGLGGLTAVAPRADILITYEIVLWTPPIGAAFWCGGAMFWMGLTFLILLAYLILQSVHYNRDYWNGLRREIELEEARRAAEVASRAKSSFVANISHEIRTPMHGVLGMLDLVLSESLPAGQRGMIETARGSADSLLALLDDILDFSKIEADRLELESIPFRLPDLVETVARMMGVKARQKGLDLAVLIGADVPGVVIGDPVRLRQVLVNLVTNAVKFTSMGSVAVSLGVEETAGAKHRIRFCVEDTGIGIPPDKQRLIFDAFAQADSATTRKFGGSGLGLAISRRLTVLMGGDIELSSEPERGSKFSFTLWLEEGTLAEAAPSPVIAAPARTMRVLVAEDNLVNQRLARAILERAGHSVEIAPNGAVAVERWNNGGFDVILMDLQMPELGGDEATSRIRAAEAKGHRIPIIGLTANANPHDRQRCFEAGMDDYLTKPFRPADLLEVLARHSLARLG